MDNEQYTQLCVQLAELKTMLSPIAKAVDDHGQRITKLEKLEVKFVAYCTAIGAGLTAASKYLLPAVLALVVVHGTASPSHEKIWEKSQWSTLHLEEQP